MDALPKDEKLSPHELAVLVSIMRNQATSGATVSYRSIKEDLERAGFTPEAAFIALMHLVQKNMIIEHDNGYYSLNELGKNWILKNEDQFNLKVKLDLDIPF